MANFNDAEITSLYVAQQSSPAVQDDAPNTPGGGQYAVTLEMVAGNALQAEDYSLTVTCTDLTAATPAATLNPPPQFSAATQFGQSPWTPSGTEWWTFSHSETVGPEPATGQGHVYQYTAALYTKNGQIASIKQSDPFILI